jgi:hypothetical protein
MAVAAWVRRLPLRGSKWNVLTLCGQRVQVKSMAPPPLSMRAMV